MTQPIILSKSDARRLAIAHQGLHATSPFGKGKQGVYETIAHLGYVQIDTISVTERAHNHILWSRVPDFKQKHLLELQQRDRRILEFWAHAAAYLPMKDYRFLIPTMEYFRNHNDSWPKSDKKTMKWVMDRIRDEGALKSRDFEAPENQSKAGWWDWKPAKWALQRLFFFGEIMVSHRDGFQRVFDLRERVLPSDIDTTTPAMDEYAHYLILNTIRAHGFARPAEMHYLRRAMGDHVRKAANALCDAGEILRLNVKGVKGDFFSTTEQINTPVRVANKVKLLSPFDNAVIQRDRISDLFGFDFQIECYVPKPKRKFGYYCLPILYGDQFYGRIDVKADRKTKELELISTLFESKPMPGAFSEALAKACVDFARFNQCDKIKVSYVSNADFKKIFVTKIDMTLEE